MKRRVLLLIFAGIMLTGCADQGSSKQAESDVVTIDWNGDNGSEDAKEEQVNAVSSDAGETVPGEEAKETQNQEQETAEKDSAENIQNDGNEQELYMQFLNNQVSVIVSNDYPQADYRVFYLERGDSYTFAELGQYVNQSYFDPEYSEKTSYDSAQYTYVECLDSDSQNLLVKFVGLNIYTQGDDSFAVYVISEDNGQLYLTAEYECWARSYTEQYRNGLCNSGGSGGAGDHYEGISAILSDGKMTNIYEAEILSGWWTNYVNETIYNEVFDGNTEVPLNVSIYSIGENQYYMYDFSECTDDQLPLCETYINRCRDEADINWITDEEVQEAVRKRCGSLGIDYNELGQCEEVKWTDL